MDFDRNLVHELQKEKSAEVEQAELERGRKRMRKLGILEKTTEELREEGVVITVEDYLEMWRKVEEHNRIIGRKQKC